MYMNIFKKLWRCLSREEAVDIQPDEPRVVQLLGEINNCIFHPGDLMEPLLLSIVWETKKPACCSLNDIKLYSLYDMVNGAFIGSYYALKIDGLYYGNIVGDRCIFSCTEAQFQFRETNEVVAPLRTVDGFMYALRCKYDCKKAKLTVLQLEKVTKGKEHGTILHVFEKEISFNNAAKFSLSLIK